VRACRHEAAAQQAEDPAARLHHVLAAKMAAAAPLQAALRSQVLAAVRTGAAPPRAGRCVGTCVQS
jgi:hypothetical protein